MEFPTAAPTVAEQAQKRPPTQIHFFTGGEQQGSRSLAHIGNKFYEQARVLRCVIDIGEGAQVEMFAPDHEPGHIYIQSVGDGRWQTWHCEVVDVDPFVTAEVLGNAFTSTRMEEQWGRGGWQRHKDKVEVPDTYQETYHEPGADRSQNHHHVGTIPWNHLKVKLTHPPTGTSREVTLKFKRPDTGVVHLDDRQTNRFPITTSFFGLPIERPYFVNEFHDFLHLLNGGFEVEGGTDALWDWWLARKTPAKPPMDGIKSLFTRKAIAPNIERLQKEEPLLWSFLRWMQDKKTADKMTNNKLIGAMLRAHGADYDAFRGALRAAMDGAGNTEVPGYATQGMIHPARNICLTLPGASEAVVQKKAKTQWQFQKTAEGKAEGLGINMGAYPLLMAAIGNGDIPFGIFHEPGDPDHLINVEFDLWERSLAREGWAEVLYGISKNASSRNTYTRRVTSYMGFLFKVEKYLDKHAPRPNGGRWKSMPKWVESQWELEMDEVNETGTTKKRSALTPVADNETGILTVPYCAMQISGMSTTYCYSDLYFVAEEGINDPIGQGIWTSDLEVGLNGRDDYGLMSYTLTGTDRNSGYPTFLVIFERLPRKRTTRVHFHRVHPNRSKKGKPTPTNRLIRECYRYMAGNVRPEEIYAQQGDLIFIRAERPGKAVEAAKNVQSFESHAFVPLFKGAPPVQLVESVAKSPTNRLGYLYSEVNFAVVHPEHEDLPGLEGGTWWEVRRCKSYENNPVAVWSLTID